MTGRLYGFDPIAAIAFVHYVCHLGFPIWLHWNPNYISIFIYNLIVILAITINSGILFELL